MEKAGKNSVALTGTVCNMGELWSASVLVSKASNGLDSQGDLRTREGLTICEGAFYKKANNLRSARGCANCDYLITFYLSRSLRYHKLAPSTILVIGP